MAKNTNLSCDVCGNSYNTRFEYFNKFKGDNCCESCLELKTTNYFKLGNEQEVLNYIFKLLMSKGVKAIKKGNYILIEKRLPNGLNLIYKLSLYCDFYDCTTNVVLDYIHNVKGLNKGFIVGNGSKYSLVRNNNYTNALNSFKKVCINIGRDKEYRYENIFDISIADDNSSLNYKHTLNIDILNGDSGIVGYNILDTLVDKLAI